MKPWIKRAIDSLAPTELSTRKPRDRSDWDVTLTTNGSELRFVLKARDKGAQVHRAGWPDFLIELNGAAMFVEVKAKGDMVRPSQGRMFAALERLGHKVFIWDPAKPDTLANWRRYEARRKRSKAYAKAKRRKERARKRAA